MLEWQHLKHLKYHSLQTVICHGHWRWWYQRMNDEDGRLNKSTDHKRWSIKNGTLTSHEISSISSSYWRPCILVHHGDWMALETRRLLEHKWVDKCWMWGRFWDSIKLHWLGNIKLAGFQCGLRDRQRWFEADQISTELIGQWCIVRPSSGWQEQCCTPCLSVAKVIGSNEIRLSNPRLLNVNPWNQYARMNSLTRPYARLNARLLRLMNYHSKRIRVLLRALSSYAASCWCLFSCRSTRCSGLEFQLRLGMSTDSTGWWLELRIEWAHTWSQLGGPVMQWSENRL